MTAAKKTTSKSDGWAGSAADWRARNVHRAELWSGMRILFRFPTLGELLTNGKLPETLLALAVAEYAEPGGIAKQIAATYDGIDEDTPDEVRAKADARVHEFGEQIAALNRELCAAALVEPKLTADNLANPDFPMQDLEMLAGILNREIVYDAAGRRIGVEPLDTFRVFRDQHACAESCPECAASRRELSSVHAGAM